MAALQQTQAARFRVLLVDDERAVLDSIAGVLSEDVDVVCCSSSGDALKALDREQFHVVCSDFKMPGMNGVELLHEVSSRSQATGCLLLTGADDYVKRRGQSQYYVMLKPFDPVRLITLVLQLARIAGMKSAVGQLGAGTARGRGTTGRT
jgi:DNA-binding NtrC family response regulator